MDKDKKIEELISIVTQLHGYSRRYCDNRSSYAPSEHNMLTRKLLEMGVELPHDPISNTGPFAKDGMYGLEPEHSQWLKEHQLSTVPHLSFLAEQLQPFLKSSPAQALEVAQSLSQQPHQPVDEEQIHHAFLCLAAHYLAAQREQEGNKLIAHKAKEYVNNRETNQLPSYHLYLELKSILEQVNQNDSKK